MKNPPGWLWCFVLCWLTWPVQADIKTLNQWISQFRQDGISLFSSSEFLTPEKLNQPIELSGFEPHQFNQVLKRLSLQLETIYDRGSGEPVYLIKSHKTTPTTTVLIHALDSAQQSPVKQFSLQWPATTPQHSEAGTILLTGLTRTFLQARLIAPGYYPADIDEPLILGKTVSLTIDMQPLPLALSDIRVSTSLINYNSGTYSHHSFSRAELDRQVSINRDPLRSREQLPGSASNGINGKVHTRGGNLNESLVLLDGRELRNPYHFKDFFSLFSTINDTVVDSIDHYSGVFPVQYGGRLSSVLDVQTNPWSPVKTHQLNFGLLTSSYTLQTLNPSADRSLILALRTGGQLFTGHLAEDLSVNPEYDDAYFKAAQVLNEHWQMSQHVLVSRDELSIDQDEETARAAYHDQNIWIKWNYDDLQQHQLDIQLYGSRRHDRRQGMLQDNNSQSTVDEDITSHFQGIQFTHQWQLNDATMLHYGFDVAVEDTRILSYRMLNHNSELVNELGLGRQLNRPFEFDQHGVSAKSFANLRYQFNSQWTADFGVHYQHQQWVNGGKLSPRFNLAYFISEQTTWRLGIGRHQQNQHIDELLLEDPEPGYFEPASADLAVLELNHRFSNDWYLRAEMYLKKYSATHPYYENLFNHLHVLPDLFYDRIRLDPDDARAMGIEWTLSGQQRNISWAASYAYADVTDQIGSLDIVRSWNQRNAFKLMLGIPVGQWNFNLNASFHNGWPLTRIVPFEGGYQVETRNQLTEKDFYQLSIRFERSWEGRLGLWQIDGQLSNALNTDNPCCREYFLDESGLGFVEKYGLPLVPDLRISLSWD
ncbi:TonB-dependent receptor plug domain-containing protein [Marinicella sediminis]|uniref:TonB-dependent receptor plug domain-containing protein n=1 Tax=Marinicella sediminis TaxID=1792834 RepID=A0ABV7J7A0_9GAMM|nr:TonB-dependent receptor [Marinicella sediminis]